MDVKFALHHSGKQQVLTHDTVQDHVTQQIQKTFRHGDDMVKAMADMNEMVRLAPSASNRQPWRIIRHGVSWHFYVQRSSGYRRTARLGGVPDLQRVDMGIAMCHWELTAREAGLHGHWVVQEPAIAKPDDLYTVMNEYH